MANDNLSLELSASDVIGFTGWPDAMVSDYIAKGADYMLVGSGNPNTSSTPANRTRQYLDSDTGQMYVNPIIGNRTGWVAV